MKGEKTVEVRKFLIKDPNFSGKFKCYVSKDKQSLNRIPEADRAEFEKNIGNVAFEFVKCGVMCEEALHMRHGLKDSCLTHEELDNYGKDKPLYGYRVTALNVYDKPRAFGEFNKYIKCKRPCNFFIENICRSRITCIDKEKVTRPPQNYIKIMEV